MELPLPELLRQERQPKLIRDIAWKGQLRLCARYRRLARTGHYRHHRDRPRTVGLRLAIARQVTVTTG